MNPGSSAELPPPSLAAAFASGRLYLLGALGTIVTVGADTGDLSGAHLRPASVQGAGRKPPTRAIQKRDTRAVRDLPVPPVSQGREYP